MKLCKVEVCDHEATGPKGMCRAHYNRQRLGQPVEVKITRKAKVGRAICTIPDCGRTVSGGGLCHLHARRKRRGADLYAPVRCYIQTNDLHERLRHYAPEGEPNECWEWTGSRNKGYGNITIANSKLRGAHIVAWELANGRKLPSGMMVRHKCDNPPCTNPAHLELGTNADNMRDMVERGRQSRKPRQRLSDRDVLEICRRYDQEGILQTDLSTMFNIHLSHINSILCGRSWNHLTNRRAAG